MVFDRVVFGEFVAVALFGDDVQQLRAFAAAQVFQYVNQMLDVVTVHGAGVAETEVFKQRQRLLGVFGFARQRFDFVFDFLGKLHRAGQLVQNLARLRLDCAQHAAHIAHDVAGEVFRQRADVRGNRHFVVV